MGIWNVRIELVCLFDFNYCWFCELNSEEIFLFCDCVVIFNYVVERWNFVLGGGEIKWIGSEISVDLRLCFGLCGISDVD